MGAGFAGDGKGAYGRTMEGAAGPTAEKPDHNVCIPDCSVTSNAHGWYDNGWSDEPDHNTAWVGYYAEGASHTNTGYHLVGTFGSWTTPDSGNPDSFFHNDEKTYSIDGVCVASCPGAGDVINPETADKAQIDYFGAAVAATVDGDWWRTTSNDDDPMQALHYNNKGECLSVCVPMGGNDYYAMLGSMTCITAH